MQKLKKIVIIGGCGHAGLPPGIVFANCGLDVVLLDRTLEVATALSEVVFNGFSAKSTDSRGERRTSAQVIRGAVVAADSPGEWNLGHELDSSFPGSAQAQSVYFRDCNR
jgi:hypothetical protein